MKQKSIIVASFLFSFFLLTSCGDGSPSACDCAEYKFNSIQESLKSDKTEHKLKVIEKWAPKLDPCEEKAKADPSFKEEMDKCLMKIRVERL